MKKELYKGPDISKHNGNVNIKRVRDAGYKRIGIRAGYGKIMSMRNMLVMHWPVLI